MPNIKLKSIRSNSWGLFSNDDWNSVDWQLANRDINGFTPYFEAVLNSLDDIPKSLLKARHKKSYLPNLTLDSIVNGVFGHQLPNQSVINVNLDFLSVLPGIANSLLQRNLNSDLQFIGHLNLNHPTECNFEMFTATQALVDSGWILNNITYLENDLNLCPNLLKDLNLKLLQMRIRPYAFIIEDQNFLDQSLNILDSLRGWTSGLAVPHLLLKTGSGYKHCLPNYVHSSNNESFVFRNYRNFKFTYINEPSSIDN